MHHSPPEQGRFWWRARRGATARVGAPSNGCCPGPMSRGVYRTYKPAHHSSAGDVNSRNRIAAKTTLLWVLKFLLGPSRGKWLAVQHRERVGRGPPSSFATHDILMSPGQHEI